jgi:formate/nitrite transporter
MANGEVSIDALMPGEMAGKAEAVGIRKANMDAVTMFALSILAGAFIALGAIYATTVSAGAGAMPYGVARLLAGLVFCLGLVLVIVAGAELFTGNNLIVMAWANGKVSTSKLVRNWTIVWTGNFVGAIATAVIMLLTKQYMFGKGSVGVAALGTAAAKAGLDPIQAFFLGVMCNALVCVAVWLCFSARSTTDKILSIIFPISAFVAAGFEHSIANMYFIPVGLLIKQFAVPAFWASDALAKAEPAITVATYAKLTWSNFFINNLIPVTLGNIVGGALMVGLMYWFIYLRPKKAPAAQAPKVAPTAR